MKKSILFFLLVCNYSFSQVIISNDTTVCGNFNDTIYALSAVQSSMQVDDQHDVAVPIGFTFNFYGLPYNQCVVSGNGYLTFDTTLASSYSPYSINTPIPNPGNVPENAILAPWHDINTGVSGNIYYGTTGVAPNRMFTVTWCQIAMFSCTDSIATSQVVLHEGSDKIDMFIQSKPLCAGWNGGNAVHGLVNLGSTLADIVLDPTLLVDRNYPNQWDAYDEGWEFLPNGTLNYTINQIPYVPIVAGQNIWTSATGDTLGYGPTLPVNISSTTTYYADVVGSCSSGILSDDVTINVSGCFDITLSSTDASCLGNDGEILVNPGVGTPAPYDMLLLDMNGVVLQNNFGVNTPQTFYNLFPGTYVARVIDAGGSSSQDTVVVLQATNPLNVSSFVSNVSCYNGSNGQISILADNGALPYSFYLDGVLNSNPYPYDSVFTSLSSSPKEKRLKNEIHNLKSQYEIINNDLEQIELVLDNIQQRDDNIYRTIFEADPIPTSIRKQGFGGVNRYKKLSGYSNSDLIINTSKKIDQLTKQLYLQSKSFDEVIDLAKNKSKMLASIPAIQPVANKDLKRMASGYGYRIHPIYKTRKMHYGMDFSAKVGTEIYATGDGVISKVKRSKRGYGNYVKINHGFGYETLYAHMSKYIVKKGQKVKRGEVIGYVGNTGISTAPHLHYEVRKDNRKINPVNFYYNDLTPEEYEKMLELSSQYNQSFD